MIKSGFTLLILLCFISFVRANDRTGYLYCRLCAEDDSLGLFANKKNIPDPFRKPILKALSYFPELKNISIDFVIKKNYTPLSTRPSFRSMFKRKNRRTYIITISNETIDTLSHLLYNKLSYTEQVGIMGHELSHVVDFNNKSFFRSIGNAIGHLSKHFIDKMEYKTDLICIQHGLGKYLETYSLHVRKTMHVKYWRGVDHVFEKDDHIERYMNPSTIEKYMQTATVNPDDGK
ncbi:MAG: hypothetical protein JST09_04370 [Bacteroidetes bacterium]|nr:hypothetical protein [Bacteroidota bacterium]